MYYFEMKGGVLNGTKLSNFSAEKILVKPMFHMGFNDL